MKKTKLTKQQQTKWHNILARTNGNIANNRKLSDLDCKVIEWKRMFDELQELKIRIIEEIGD